MRQPRFLRNRNNQADNANGAEHPAFQPDTNDYLSDILSTLQDISTDLRAVLNHLEKED
jgi:hypothetical protein